MAKLLAFVLIVSTFSAFVLAVEQARFELPNFTTSIGAAGTWLTDDARTGHITIDTPRIRAVLHYGYLASEFEDQGGCNIYQLFDKRSSTPNQNLLAYLTREGSPNTPPVAVGAGGIGNTEMYSWPVDPNNPALQPSFATYTGDRLNEYLSDNRGAGHARLVTTPSYSVDGNGLATVSCDLIVSDPQFHIDWYEVKKLWTIEPTGIIQLRQDWTLLRSGWISEVATRFQLSYDVGWTQLKKFGHNWNPAVSGCDWPATPSLLNGNACASNQWVVIPPDGGSLVGSNAGCFSAYDGFLAQQVTLSGSPTAPDMTIIPDNQGRGIEGGGLWQLMRAVTNQTATDSVFEECAYNRRSIGDGDAAYGLGFFSWWGGDPAPADRYRYVDVTRFNHWVDTYKLVLTETTAPASGAPAATSRPPAAPPAATSAAPSSLPAPLPGQLQVVDTGGKPVANAQVTIRGANGKPEVETTDRNGMVPLVTTTFVESIKLGGKVVAVDTSLSQQTGYRIEVDLPNARLVELLAYLQPSVPQWTALAGSALAVLALVFLTRRHGRSSRVVRPLSQRPRR